MNSALYFLKSAFNTNFTESEIPLMNINDTRLNVLLPTQIINNDLIRFFFYWNSNNKLNFVIKIKKFKTINDEDDSTKTIKNEEVKKFQNSIYEQQLILRVTKVLGLDRNLTLSKFTRYMQICIFKCNVCSQCICKFIL